jgi:plasmid stabilization system protein ParE
VARVLWAKVARQDLRDIKSYVARDSREAAAILASRIVAAGRHLGMFPHSGRVVPEFEDPDLREVIFQNYRIIYLVQGRRVRIARIVHGAMELEGRTREEWQLL